MLVRVDNISAGFSGEDAKLKQMLWVVENLQEELFRSKEYRLAAEKRQQNEMLTNNGKNLGTFPHSIC